MLVEQQGQISRCRRCSITWAVIGPDQVSGMAVEVYCAIVLGSINTEAPIRGYTQASRQYLEHFYPPMAQFVGGTVDALGQVITPGLWELEEKRHTPALTTIHHRLSPSIPTGRGPISPAATPAPTSTATGSIALPPNTVPPASTCG